MPRGSIRISDRRLLQEDIQLRAGSLVILTERDMQYRQNFTDGGPYQRILIRPGTAIRPLNGTAKRWWSPRPVSGTIYGWMPRKSFDRRRAKLPRRFAARTTEAWKLKSP